MGKLKRARSYLPSKQLMKLQNYHYPPALVSSSEDPYKLSDDSSEHKKLAWREVYDKIIRGDFFIAEAERSKTGGKKSAICWSGGL